MRQDNMITERPHPAGMGGVQRLYRFANSFGASVVQTPWTYGGEEGLWELAVLHFAGSGNDEFALTYKTPVTNDVEGHLTEEDVDAFLVEIAALAPTADSNRKGVAK